MAVKLPKIGKETQRKDMQRFLPANVIQDLEFIRPLMHHGHEAVAQLNESYVKWRIAAFKAFFDGVKTTP
jgi:hypothetical protein